MSFDRSDITALLAERKRRTNSQDRVQPHILRMAAVAMEKLTGRSEWDGYLKMLEARLEDVREAKAKVLEAFTNPALVSHEEMIALKLRYAELSGAQEAFSQAIALPSELMQTSKENPPLAS